MLRKMFLKAPVVSSRVREWPSSRVAEWPSGRVAEWPSGLLFGSFLRDTSNLFRCYDLVLQDELNVLKIGIKDEMEQFPSLITNVKDLKRKKELENLISVYDEGEARFLVMRNPSDFFSHFSSVHDTGIVKIFRLSKVIWDCILLCSLIGPEYLRHSRNQLHAKLKPAATWSPAFSRALGSLVVFYFEFWLALIGNFLSSNWLRDYFGFATLSRETF